MKNEVGKIIFKFPLQSNSTHKFDSPKSNLMGIFNTIF